MLNVIRKITLSIGAVAALYLAIGSSQPASAQSDPYVGQLMLVGFPFCPEGWAEADGQLLTVGDNPELFSLYLDFFGGNGRTTFGLPDLRGRFPMHTGTGVGLTARPQGQSGGAETVALAANESPTHNHPATTTATLNATTNPGSTPTPSSAVVHADARGTDVYDSAANNVTLRSDAITATTTVQDNTGGGQGHDNMPPFLVLRWCVALEGVYPVRN